MALLVLVLAGPLLVACTSSTSSVPTTVRDASIGPSIPTTIVQPLPSMPPGSERSEPAPWEVDTKRCAADSGVDDPITATLTIGSIAPQTGGLVSAVYAPVIKGFEAYIDHANATRLLGDLQLNLVVADDQGDPALTPAAAGGLIAANADVVTGVLGSANNLAIRDLLNTACIPQLMALGNSARFGDVASYPWTMGALVPVTVETTVYVNSIVRSQGESSTVALLVTDDSVGQTFANSFTAAAADTALTIVETQVVEPNVIVAPNAQLLQIAAQQPDAIVASLTGAACATFLIELANIEFALGGQWTPTVYMSSGCADPSILSLAGNTADGVYTSSTLVTDEPTFDAARAAAGVTDGLAAAAEGWTAAEATVAIIEQAAQSDAGLTRASIIDAARHLDITPSLGRPGVHFITDGTDDGYPAESLQVIRYVASSHDFVDVGPIVAQFES